VSDKSAERVLVIPTSVFHAAGLFQGFSPEVARYLPRLLDPAHLRYLPRGEAETDPAFKQLIPYVVLRWRDQLFHYTRGPSGAEARLRALRSVGIGGHICAEDAAAPADAYRAGLLREVAEEVELGCAYRERAVGLINDDGTPVGQVHLGVVHVFDLAEPRARLRDPALTAGGFAPLAALRQRKGQFETWSQFLLEDGRLGEGPVD
jgi:predicted NUDIX family phosphoesterase